MTGLGGGRRRPAPWHPELWLLVTREPLPIRACRYRYPQWDCYCARIRPVRGNYQSSRLWIPIPAADYHLQVPNLDRIYTKTGDEGMTGLGGGRRVSKDSARVRAYGTVDELNSVLGVALALGLTDRLVGELGRIQNELFDLGSDLCWPEDDERRGRIPTVQPRHVKQLEAAIDELNAVVGPLANFLLPGGSPGAAQLHVARTVCRRAEREAITLSHEEPIGDLVLPYLNRLSDLLFVMARFENHQRGVAEPLWQPGL